MILTTEDKAVQNAVKNAPTIFEEMRRRRLNQAHPHRPFYDILPDAAWSGQAAFIVGGGGSLRGFDFERLRGHGRIIAINRAFEFIPFADILFFMDYRFYQLVHKNALAPGTLEKWNAFAGHRVMLNILGRELDDIYSIRGTGQWGLSGSIRKGLYYGNNSGYGAINLAFALAASPIYLLGFDGKLTEKKAHFHSGYTFEIREGVVRSFIRDFEKMADFIAGTSARIINLNPDSAYRRFEFKTVDEVLGNGKTG